MVDVFKQEYFWNKEVVIVNVQKFFEDFWEENLFDDFFELVIVDEVYYFLVEMWFRIIRKFEIYVLVVFFMVILFRSDYEMVVECLFVYYLIFSEVRDN